MRSRCFRLLLVLLLTTLPFLQTGCWSSNEINNLAITTALGIDKAEDGKYQITALIVRSNSLFKSGTTGGSGGSQESPSLIISGEGDSLFGAMRNLSTVLAKRMYWAHLQVIVFGADEVKRGLATDLDILAREHEFRKNINILVTRGRAEDIIRLQPQLEGTLGAEIGEIITYSRLTSTTRVSDISEFLTAMANDTIDAVTGEITEASKVEGKIKVGNGRKDSPAVALNGTAAFKKGSLVGWLNRQETRGLLWVTGKVKSGIVQVNCIGNGHPRTKQESERQGKVSLEITRSSSSIRPKISGEDVRFEVEVNVDAEVGEIACNDFEMDSASMEKLNRMLEEQVRQDIQLSLAKAKEEWVTDVFGFGQKIYRSDPQAWAKLAPTWREDGLKNASVHLDVHANIWRNGSIHDPTKVDESK
jgi:spore germination protein KC